MSPQKPGNRPRNRRPAASRTARRRSLLTILSLSVLLLAATVAGQDREEGKDPKRFRDRAAWLHESLGGMVGSSFDTYSKLAEVVIEALPEWQPLGPTGYVSGDTLDNTINRMGRINALAFHPTDPEVLYAGAPNGGLWKRDARGWKFLFQGLQTRRFPQLLAISGIAVDPQDPEVVYVLTGDGDGAAAGLPAVPSFGVMKSTDGGENFEKTGLTWDWADQKEKRHLGFKLAMDPCNSKLLYAVTNQGLWRTENAGEDWSGVKSDAFGDDEEFRDLEFQPAPESGCSGPTAVVYAASTSRIYRSTNGGADWERSDVRFPDLVAQQAEIGYSRIELAVTPANRRCVYALVGVVQQGFLGLYRSPDEGKSFELRSNTPNVLGSQEMGWDVGSQADYTVVLAVSPVNADDVHAGSINTWRSVDGGGSWCLSGYWQELDYLTYLHADTHALVFRKVPGMPGYDLYAGTDGGVSVARDATSLPAPPARCGLPWKDLSEGLRITQTYRLCSAASGSDLVYLGNQDNGTYRLGGPIQCHGSPIPPRGTACTIANGDGGTCLVDHQDPKVVYLTKQSGRIFKSTDSGERVVSVTPPASNSERSQTLTSLAMDPVDPSIVYAGYIDVWMTPDGGDVWKNLSDGKIGTSHCRAMAKARSADGTTGVLYVAKNQKDKLPVIYWTENEGADWKSVTFPEESGTEGSTATVTDVVSSSVDPQRAWITAIPASGSLELGLLQLNAETGELKKFEHRLAIPLPILETMSFGARALSISYGGKTPLNGDRLFVGTQIGVFHGECGETSCSWLPFMRHPFIILDLETRFGASGQPEAVYAATYAQGVWKLDNPLPPGL